MEEATVPDVSSVATKSWTEGFGNVESVIGDREELSQLSSGDNGPC